MYMCMLAAGEVCTCAAYIAVCKFICMQIYTCHLTGCMHLCMLCAWGGKDCKHMLDISVLKKAIV